MTIKKVIFVVKLLQSMNIVVKLQVMVRIDKIGAIFMTGNVTTTSHSKHLDIRYKY